MESKTLSSVQTVQILAEKNRDNSKATKRRNCSSGASKEPKQVRIDSFVLEKQKAVAKSPADNPYAREIFMCKTNVREIVTKATEENPRSQTWDARKRRKQEKVYLDRLYRSYVEEPKYRIREPLHQLRFVNSYYEYRFFLALKKPLCSEIEYANYMKQLQLAGVKECMVRMRKKNLLLKLEDNVVAQVRKRFPECWSGKLEKLPLYLMDAYQQHIKRKNKPKLSKEVNTKESLNDQMVEEFLKHSNARSRGSKRQINSIVPIIDCYLEHSETAGWLEFNDDKLNKKYKVGPYLEKSAPVALPVPMDYPEAATPNSLDTVQSFNSEMEHMRAEMAMTQPSNEIPITGSFFASTMDVISALSTTRKNPTDESSIEAVEIPELEVSSPHPSEAVTVDDNVGRQQEEVYEITDPPAVRPNESTSAQNNISKSKTAQKKSAQATSMLVSQTVEKQGGDRSTSALARQKSSKVSSIETAQCSRALDQLKSPNRATTNTGHPPKSTLLQEKSSHQTIASPSSTPIFNACILRPRRISYESESQLDANSLVTRDLNAIADTMPNTEEFCPPVCSTQVPGQEQMQNESSFSLITPAQRKIYEISDSPPSAQNVASAVQNTKTGTSYTLEYLRNNSNIDQLVIEKIKEVDPNRAEQRILVLDKYVKRFYNRARDMLARNIFPDGLRLLTKDELSQKKESSNLNQKSPITITEEVSLHNDMSKSNEHRPKTAQCTTTASITNGSNIPTIPRRSISSDLVLQSDARSVSQNRQCHTTPVPVASARLQSHQETPFCTLAATRSQITTRQNIDLLPQNRSPSRMDTISSNTSRALHVTQQQQLRGRIDSASDHDSSSSNITVLHNSVKSPEVNVKQERNISDYASEVECQGEVNNEIVLSDDDEPAMVDANELIERHSKDNQLEQIAQMPVMPHIIKDRVDELFQSNHDKTLSQSSSDTGTGSQSTNSQNDRSARADAVGFR
ncbi:uncharacterized protein LOC128740374 [Sabethes cyaneus]|uniref:uncharacterized protein LOC128740374 n=1 Tax=Sabethes cyaneus TaxID=53552 RepID=UPI00237E0881|nr:uncharacterized protein LOC128740374 [Sabethes cyaneus]